jgi:hypothetical protein
VLERRRRSLCCVDPIRIEKPSGVEEELDDAELEAKFGYAA